MVLGQLHLWLYNNNNQEMLEMSLFAANFVVEPHLPPRLGEFTASCPQRLIICRPSPVVASPCRTFLRLNRSLERQESALIAGTLDLPANCCFDKSAFKPKEAASIREKKLANGKHFLHFTFEVCCESSRIARLVHARPCTLTSKRKPTALTAELPSAAADCPGSSR